MRPVSRRSFFKFCSIAAAGIGLDPFDIAGLSKALASPTAPTLLWLQGSACSGSTSANTDAADVLIHFVNLACHPELAAVTRASAASELEQLQRSGNFILVIEGGVPTTFGGGACYAWDSGSSDQGEDDVEENPNASRGWSATFQQTVLGLAARAKAVLCLGTGASFGSIPAAPSAPGRVPKMSSAIGRSTINLTGCPPHPAWTSWTLVQLLQGKSLPLVSQSRMPSLYGAPVERRVARAEKAGSLRQSETLSRRYATHRVG